MWRSKRCYIALLLFSTIFLGLFVRSSDASAVSDVVYYIDSSTQPTSGSTFELCGSLSSVSCSDYSFVRVSLSSLPQQPLSATLRVNVLNSNSGNSFLQCAVYFLSSSLDKFCSSSIPSSVSSIFVTNIPLSSNLANYSFKVVLSNSSSSSGTLSITENGTFNVSSYEYAEVNVPAPPVVTPYDNKLDSLIQAVYVVAGTMLVIYFFYALYRIYMGGKT